LIYCNMSDKDIKHHRRSIRLPEYDYSQEGAYYVTICTKDRKCLFGGINDGRMALNPFGIIIIEELLRTPEIRREISLGEWVIMPNHVHAIVMINDHYDDVGATGRSPLPCRAKPCGPKPHSLASFIAGFKSGTAKRINEMRKTTGCPVWQRNYWEHVIRNQKSCDKIRQYIIENPLYWCQDEENPERKTYKEIK